jgi:hypothetical protein
MKKIFSIIAGILLTASVFAQAPQKMSYQAVIRNSSKALIISTPVGMKISILKGSATGTAVYVETQTTTTNANGLVSVEIGSGTVVTGTFAGIDWAAGPYFIKSETDPTGGTGYTIVGTNELMSVPYALFSANGTPGTTGAAGPAGSSGAAGAQGPIGLTGATGAQGPIGLTGPAGNGVSISVGAIGGSSNANGATISSGTLNLTPADATNGGIVTTGTQTFAGDKTFTGSITNNGKVIVGGSSASAVLEASSTTQGFLPPRMTYNQRMAITSPATGLVVFCTDCGPQNIPGELEVYFEGLWRNMMGGAAFGTVPTITVTTVATSIAAATATSGGNITSDGGTAILARGVCWSTSQNPTTADAKTIDAGTTGAFTSSLTGLVAITTYYVRSYATNIAGTSYGPQINFTSTTPVVPTVDRISTLITTTTASSGTNVSSDGGAAITAEGVCWSTTINPDISLSTKTSDGTTLAFTSNITGLTRGTIYYVRSYATNSAGTGYGTQVSFRTMDYDIGEAKFGGIIAYCLQPGDLGFDANVTHGLIAAVADLGTAPWGCPSTTISGLKETSKIGQGNQNTIDIMAGCAELGIAARLCGDLVEGGYDDWYLPSLNELLSVCLNGTAIGGFANNSYYWSSSEWEWSEGPVHTVYFSVPYSFHGGGHSKANTTFYRVRAIRSF